MYDVIERDGAVVLRGAGELGKDELGAMAAVAAAARRGGLRVVLDLRGVSHLHYAGARSVAAVRGVSAAVATRYVRDLLVAGAGGAIELYSDVEDALRAA